MNDFATGLIHGLCELESARQTAICEQKNPQPEIKEKDPVKQAIKEMLTENTGCHILDSGGAYGRHWTENRKRNFDEEPSVSIEVWDEEINISYNVYHYLNNFLQLNDECKKLQRSLNWYVNREDSKGYLQDIRDFAAHLEQKRKARWHGITNTYNYDNIISQILQYAIIELDAWYYIVLQIHNGCDARGGYTKPRVFLLGDEDAEGYFHLAQNDLSVYCNKCGMHWWSDDGGYHFYYENCTHSQKKLTENENDIETELKFIGNQEKNKAFHKNCGGELIFTVTEGY
jgi:hypothetical protein